MTNTRNSKSPETRMAVERKKYTYLLQISESLSYVLALLKGSVSCYITLVLKANKLRQKSGVTCLLFDV